MPKQHLNKLAKRLEVTERKAIGHEFQEGWAARYGAWYLFLY